MKLTRVCDLMSMAERDQCSRDAAGFHRVFACTWNMLRVHAAMCTDEQEKGCRDAAGSQGFSLLTNFAQCMLWTVQMSESRAAEMQQAMDASPSARTPAFSRHAASLKLQAGS